MRNHPEPSLSTEIYCKKNGFFPDNCYFHCRAYIWKREWDEKKNQQLDASKNRPSILEMFKQHTCKFAHCSVLMYMNRSCIVIFNVLLLNFSVIFFTLNTQIVILTFNYGIYCNNFIYCTLWWSPSHSELTAVDIIPLKVVLRNYKQDWVTINKLSLNQKRGQSCEYQSRVTSHLLVILLKICWFINFYVALTHINRSTFSTILSNSIWIVKRLTKNNGNESIPKWH